MARKVGVALKVAQQEGDSPRFELSSTVVDAFLKEGAAAGELGDLGFDEVAFLLPVAVADDFGVRLPVGQLVGCFGEGVEPGGSPGEELEEPGPHGIGGDA